METRVPYAGSFSKEGAERYKNSNSDIVHPDNFTTLIDGRPISKMAAGTASLEYDDIDDFYQYLALKHTLRSGGVNHIDTGNHFRQQAAEKIVGACLRTLIEKYGYTRDMFFINSKQGHASHDSEDNCPIEVELQEVINQSNGKLQMSDFILSLDSFRSTINRERKKVNEVKSPLFSFNPFWLNYCLNKSLDRLNIETLDLALLTSPIEFARHKDYSNEEMMDLIGRAFEFYEAMVQDGKIKEYGIYSNAAFILDPEVEGI